MGALFYTVITYYHAYLLPQRIIKHLAGDQTVPRRVVLGGKRVFLGPCGVNSVHKFLQGPEVKCACSSGEESILLYQVESLASSRQVHACLLPAAAWRSDMSGNLHSVQPVQCANVTVYKPPIKLEIILDQTSSTTVGAGCYTPGA